jgi:hypothetical protein
MKVARWSLLVLVLACPSMPARADIWDWIWQGPDCAPNTGPRHARAEYQCENKQARYLGYLDCGGLAFVAESQRQVVNQQALGAYMRPYSSFGMSSAPAPDAAPTPSPTAAPNSQPAPSTAPVPPPAQSPAAATPAPVTSSPAPPPPAPASPPPAAPLPPR